VTHDSLENYKLQSRINDRKGNALWSDDGNKQNKGGGDAYEDALYLNSPDASVAKEVSIDVTYSCIVWHHRGYAMLHDGGLQMFTPNYKRMIQHSLTLGKDDDPRASIWADAEEIIYQSTISIAIIEAR
jgi:hypothetical protein